MRIQACLSRMLTAAGCVAAALTMAGCSYLFYPKADSYLDQAKGATRADTIINLVAMLEHSAASARAPQTQERAMDELHNQLHALDDGYCQLTKPQTHAPAYEKAVTLRKEVWTIFKRLWRNREEQAIREVHLDLLTARLQEVRDTVQTLKQ